MSNPAIVDVNVSLISWDLIKISNQTFHGTFQFCFHLRSYNTLFIGFFRQVTSVLGPIPRYTFQTGKFFHELSEFVGHNPGMFMVEQLRLLDKVKSF